VLLSVVLITAIFSYYQEAKSEAIMEGFKNMVPKETTVIRNGKPVRLDDPSEITIGDLVDIGSGDQMPADVRIIESFDLKVDNASLTGESEPQSRVTDPHPHPAKGGKVVAALEAKNLGFYTTAVSSGKGKGFVIGIGDDTAMGKIAGLVTGTDAEETPIAKEIKKFIFLISGIAITLGVVFLAVSIAIGTEPVTSVVFAIGIIVANVPEGLLATVTVALALTAKRMFAKQVLVKNLQAVETLGSTSVIASDKTGTLTQNRMTVQHCWVSGQVLRVPTARNVSQLKDLCKKGEQNHEKLVDIESPSFKALRRVAVLCNNAKFLIDKGPGGESLSAGDLMYTPDFNVLTAEATSDASEQGLLKAVQLMRDAEEERAANPKSFEIPFNSTNKYQLSIHDPEEGGSPLMVFKGAPERVINFCSYINIDGKEVPLTEQWKKEFNTAYETLGGYGERVLGFAYKSLSGKGKGFNPGKDFKPSTDLVFAGLFSLIDPPKEGVPEAVEKCKTARIRVFMVTGDHPITAVAIAKQVGIIDQDKWDSGNAAVVKGDDIRDWMQALDKAQEEEEKLLAELKFDSLEAYIASGKKDSRMDAVQKKKIDGRQYAAQKFDEALDHEQLVFARVSPAHKLIIVENAQRNGEIVAVTGDGVNDAPALKKGDIGVAMGIAGKDVSKDAADMILMDDNFASIVNGVEEGRLIFDNLKKSISYTLTSNIPEIGPFLSFITINLPLPLSTVLILCVDLGTDMVPAISLAYETKESDIMARPPRNAATERLVNRRLMTFAYLQIGVIQALAGFFSYMAVLNDFGYMPRTLFGNGVGWDEFQLLCELDDQGLPKNCGYACGSPGMYSKAGEEYVSYDEDMGWCKNGCAIPTAGTADPFIEHTSTGFRGFIPEADITLSSEVSLPPVDGISYDDKIGTCGRTCDRLAAWGTQPGAKASGFFTDSDWKGFTTYCGDAEKADGTPAASLDETEKLVVTNNRGKRGILDRAEGGSDVARGRKSAVKGAHYWWNGLNQKFPNPDYQKNALIYAQTAYFICIIVVQWADLMISKTRKLSIFEQGMRNGFMNFGLVFETVLGILLVYVPPFWNLGTRPILFLHWFLGIPWSMLIFVYDETRKYLMRRGAFKGWVELTYW